ncbi:MAG TPA: glycosyltransferase family A protein [Myxococcaceae bacterium]|nr:glycosyltransferase family A protein [Myxococcaceae bacterium]
MRPDPIFLGMGSEGEVYRVGSEVVKTFRPGLPSDEQVRWLERTLPHCGEHMPASSAWTRRGERWEFRYPFEPTEPVTRLEREPLLRFLRFCIREGIVCLNFKLANFRWRRGELYFVDIGQLILPFHLPFFRDLCARAFLLLEHGHTDESLSGVTASLRVPGTLESLPGFADFFREVVMGEAQRFLATAPVIQRSAAPSATAGDVTLLVKCCAMDAADLEEQLVHIVGQLSAPRRFGEVVVAVDPFEGPFLRQYRPGDLTSLLRTLKALRSQGTIDRVLVAPRDAREVAALNRRWFAAECEQTHTEAGVPVHPQLWAFEQVKSRYLLQCDADVLIGRSDRGHDYLADLVAACEPEDVIGVGFNIPFPADEAPHPYGAPPGDFVPEVRCGLLDLDRLRALRPLPNSIQNGHLQLTWYRSLQRAQQTRGLRFVRGGDPRTYYVHPPNALKEVPSLIERVRNLVEANALPPEQMGRWDVMGPPERWQYPARQEDVVFLVMGGNIPLEKVERCARSLLVQSRQDFGTIVVDDGSLAHHARAVRELFAGFGRRGTFIHHQVHRGRLSNKWHYIRSLVPRAETLIAVLDMDDYLMHAGVAELLAQVAAGGAELAVGASFRPDKPIKLYPLDFRSAAKHRGAGNVWVHLRCFTRSAFDRLCMEDLNLDGDWIRDCSDYVTMVPMACRTSHHVILGGLLHVHERSTMAGEAIRRNRNRIIDEVLRRNQP